MRRGILVILFLNTTLSWCITPKEFFEKVSKNYTSLDSYSLVTEYLLFRGYDSEEVVERQEGFIGKTKTGAYSNQFGTETIVNKNQTVSVNHQFKQILISNPISFSPIGNDIKSTLKWCRDVRIINREKGNMILLLDFTGNSALPYKRMEISVSKNFWVQSVTFFYAHQSDFSNNYFEKDLANAKVKILYKALKKNWKDKEGILDVSRFYQRTSEGTLAGIGVQQTYQVRDLR